MTTRQTLIAAAAALSLVAVGCGEKCNEETPPVETASLKASCDDMAPNTAVTVTIPVCPTCNQGTPTCTYRADNLAAGIIQLEPLAEACESSNSCPPVNPASCPAQPLACEFVTPVAEATYTLTIVTADGSTIDKGFPIAAGGGTTCAL